MAAASTVPHVGCAAPPPGRNLIEMIGHSTVRSHRFGLGCSLDRSVRSDDLGSSRSYGTLLPLGGRVA